LWCNKDIVGFVIPITVARKLLAEVVVVRALDPQEAVSNLATIDEVLLCNNHSLNNAVFYFCEMAHIAYRIIRTPEPPAPDARYGVV